MTTRTASPPRRARHPAMGRAQRGATLVVGLIMLVLLTLVIVSAFTLSSGNLKAVGNLQFREEAIAAANVAIEQVIGTDFAAVNQITTVNVDIDGDGSTDYTVDVGGPVEQSVAADSLEAQLKSANALQPVTLIQTHPPNINELSGVNSAVKSVDTYNTMWEIQARVTSAQTGARVVVRQAIRKRLTQGEFDSIRTSVGPSDE